MNDDKNDDSLAPFRALVEQWRLEELRTREDFPDNARVLGRCVLQLHAVIEVATRRRVR